MSIKMVIDPETERRFSNLIGQLAVATGRGQRIVVRNIGRDFTKSAIINTRRAVKGRGKQRRTKFVPWKILQRIQMRHDVQVVGGGKKWAKLNRQVPIKVKGVGFAKSCWLRALTGLGLVPSSSLMRFGGKGAKGRGYFFDGRKSKTPYVDIGNDNPYIQRLDSKDHINAKSLAVAEAKMRKGLATIMRREWRNALAINGTGGIRVV